MFVEWMLVSSCLKWDNWNLAIISNVWRLPMQLVYYLGGIQTWFIYSGMAHWVQTDSVEAPFLVHGHDLWQILCLVTPVHSGLLHHCSFWAMLIISPLSNDTQAQAKRSPLWKKPVFFFFSLINLFWYRFLHFWGKKEGLGKRGKTTSVISIVSSFRDPLQRR